MQAIFYGNPNHRGQCPFYVTPENALTAEPSIHQCVTCASRNSARLSQHYDDLRQIAFLTILEETPNYDPHHPSGASFITFMKAKVCTRLWQERRKLIREMRETPYCHLDEDPHEDKDANPLVAKLTAEACIVENMADHVIQKIEVEFLRNVLPDLRDKLTKKENRVIEMKFFEEMSGVQIAQALGFSEGRVTQLTQRALVKLGKAYITALDTQQGNPYQHI